MENFVYHTPKYKLVRNMNGLKEVSESGKIALMCPECFHITETDVNYTKLISMDNIISESFTTSNSYYGACPKCGEYCEFTVIDINMAQIINILNNKGYFTAFCCEGHIDPDDYNGDEEFSCPYVYFYIWEDTNILKDYPLPDTWYIPDDNQECKVFVIYDIINNDINKFKEYATAKELLDMIKNIWDKEQSVKDLYNWAVNLPENKNKDAYYEFIKKYGSEILERNAEKIIAYDEE